MWAKINVHELMLFNSAKCVFFKKKLLSLSSLKHSEGSGAEVMFGHYLPKKWHGLHCNVLFLQLCVIECKNTQAWNSKWQGDTTNQKNVAIELNLFHLIKCVS